MHHAALAPFPPDLSSKLHGGEIDSPAAGDSYDEIALAGLTLPSFGFSRLERVTFEECRPGQTDFLEAQLDSVRFHDCDLTGGDFRGARLHRCEFRRCDLAALQGVHSLKGAALQSPDIVEMAGVWAGALGIEVLDAD